MVNTDKRICEVMFYNSWYIKWLLPNAIKICKIFKTKSVKRVYTETKKNSYTKVNKNPSRPVPIFVIYFHPVLYLLLLNITCLLFAPSKHVSLCLKPNNSKEQAK